VLPEQTELAYRDPVELQSARVPDTPPPATVSNPQPTDSEEWKLSLDNAVRTSLQNLEVVRLLAGSTAVSSGQTIYDPAIASANIDSARARFDPTLQALGSFNRFESPFGVFDGSPDGAHINGSRTDDFNLDVNVNQTNVAGGVAGAGVNTNPSHLRRSVLPLNPGNRSSFQLSYTQPLLEGAGVDVNTAPIVLARIDAERSFFQFKDSVQEHVRGVVEAYWGVVFARTDVWAREQQVAQATLAFELESARQKRGFANSADVAQVRTALANFRASRVSARSNLLQREAALRNIMGLPPVDQRRLIPTTPPTTDRIQFDWMNLLNIAQERRPDIIELKLVLEADDQQLLIAQNQVLPSVDAVALYRWNGLEGDAPSGRSLSSGGNDHTDWTLGINFSVPLGLRQARAVERQREILIVRDRVNLQQGVHSMTHTLAGNVRNLDQFFEQFDAFRESREAARENLERQVAAEQRQFQRVILLNVLQAIAAWGDAVSAEANALASYNTELASLERQTGTILETHGVRFREEQWQFAGPLLRHEVCYPADVRPEAGDESRYPDSDEPAENVFDLSNPVPTRTAPADMPPLKPAAPPLPTSEPEAATDIPRRVPGLPNPVLVPAPAADPDSSAAPSRPPQSVQPSAYIVPAEVSPSEVAPKEDRATRRQRRRAQKLAKQREAVVR
jgi:outer membrane protein TolC